MVIPCQTSSLDTLSKNSFLPADLYLVHIFMSPSIYIFMNTLLAYNYLQLKCGYEESVYCLMIKIK